MEPIRLWREDGFHEDGSPWWWNYNDMGGLPIPEEWTEYSALPRADFDALAAEAADARTLRAERDSLVKERDEAVKFWTAIADEVNEIDAVLIEDGTEGRAESSVDAVRTIIKERDAATARAEKAEALLREARGCVVISPFHKALLARIDALLRGTGAP